MRALVLLLAVSVLSFCRVGHSADEDRELVLVQALWRHGDRSPTSTFRNDVTREKDWPQGWGQLSPEGMKQHVQLGKRLRTRYVDELKFLRGHYNSHELYIRSTDLNRTLISAISNMIGFFPGGVPGVDFPGSETGWPQGYTPVAIHTVDGHEEYIGDSGTCKRRNELRQLIKQTPEYQAVVNDNKALFDFLAEKSGENIKDLSNVWIFADGFFIENLYKKPLVDWANETVLDQIQKLNFQALRFSYGLDMKEMNGVNFAKELPRVLGGTLLWSMVSNMQHKQQCGAKMNAVRAEEREIAPGLRSPLGTPLCEWLNGVKYIVYSAHDSTIASLFSTFGFPRTNFDEDGFPRYSSCVTVELWRNKASNAHEMKVHYWRPQLEYAPVPPQKFPFEEVTKHITGCEKGCSLDAFAARSADYRMEPSAKEYCEISLDGTTNSAAPLGMSFAALICSISLYLTLKMAQ